MTIRFRDFQDRAALWSFFAGYGLGWLAWWGRISEWPAIAFNGMQILSVGLLGLAIAILFKRRGRWLFQLRSLRIKVLGLLFFFGLMAIVGIPNYLAHDEGLFGLLGLLTIDLGAFVYYLSPLVLAFLTISEWRRFLLALIAGTLLLLYVTVPDMDVALAASFSDRSGVFMTTGFGLYSIQVGLAAALIPLSAIGLVLVRDKVSTALPVFVIGLAIFMAVYYSKRQGFLEAMFLIAFIGAFWATLRPSSRQWWTIMAATLGAVLALSTIAYQAEFNLLLDRLVGRTFEIGQVGLREFDRMREVRQLWEGAPAPALYLFGHGLAASADYVFARTTVHSGVANLVFKGGLPLAIFVVIALVHNLWTAARTSGLPYRGLVFFLSAFVLVQLFYAPLWGYVPTVLAVGLGFFAPEFARLSVQAPVPKTKRAKRSNGQKVAFS